MLYIDANVFLSAALYDDEEARLTREFLTDIAGGKRAAYTSVLTWDEIVWVVKKMLDSARAKQEGKKFMEFPNLVLLPAEPLIIDNAQNLMEKYNLKPRDAIHAATAISRGIREIISDDPDFDSVKELKRIPIGKFL
ncbi:MAG: type II toxin-antitoxin system VapC family toxin [Candidatus Aenigmarchaeota archaeon]|nr:type II toxin-antitoxin system VapC family toxin [Candidatus Aenigmarchaeota archaeon]